MRARTWIEVVKKFLKERWAMSKRPRDPKDVRTLVIEHALLREHQIRALEIANEVAEGVRTAKHYCAYVTPGGGKSLLASIWAHALVLGDDVDHWIVIGPRDSLRSQIRDAWTNERLGLLGGLQVTDGTQRALSARERMGYATTFQHVVANEAQWLKTMSKEGERWGIIIDEGHHLPDSSHVENQEEAAWTASVRKLVDKAKRVLTMTGSIARQDGAKIAFFNYDETTREPLPDIKYTRRQALEANAVLNVNVKLCDGAAKYWHKFRAHSHALRTAPPTEQSRVLNTLLNDPDYRDVVLTSAIAEWARHRDAHNPRSRMIVITDNVQNARAACRYIRTAHKKWLPVLAVSKEKDAHRDLARFRDKREGDILVTCQMAYEGLDVPDCTHLVCLTNIRSRPWLEQAFSRVTRFDPACGHGWDAQCAYLFVPDDPSMVSFLTEWLDEQDGRFDPDAGTGALAMVPRGERVAFQPESGEKTGERFGDNFGVFRDSDQKRLSLFYRKYRDACELAAAKALKIARDMWPDDATLDELIAAFLGADKKVKE